MLLFYETSQKSPRTSIDLNPLCSSGWKQWWKCRCWLHFHWLDAILRFRALVCSQGHCVATHNSLVLADEEDLRPNKLSWQVVVNNQIISSKIEISPNSVRQINKNYAKQKSVFPLLNQMFIIFNLFFFIYWNCIFLTSSWKLLLV